MTVLIIIFGALTLLAGIVIIRSAKETDLINLQSIFREENKFHTILEPEFIRDTEDVLRPQELKEIIEDDHTILLVAESNFKIVGAIIVSIKRISGERWKHNYKAGFVEDIIILPNYQEKGIGRLLLKNSEEWLKSKGIQSVELHVWESNKNAIQFYEAIGFKSIQRKMKKSL